MKRLLVVEDDANTLHGLEDLLRNEGYLVTGVTRGHQALAAAAREPIDVVLCDYKLPDIDGLQVCRKLQKLYPRLALFMLTAYNKPDIIRSAKECGIQRVYQKPLDLDDLLSTLSALPSAPEKEPVAHALC
jgi:CheY-like chemotaxis protein